MDQRLTAAAVAIVGVPIVLAGYIAVIEAVLGRLPSRWQTPLRPWLWLLPALSFVLVFLVYPSLYTAVLSLSDTRVDGGGFTLDNYAYFFGEGDTLAALRNNAIWLVLLTAFTVGGGLVLAALFDRVRYESVAKSIVFMPLAISFVGAGVIWRFMLAYKPPGAEQTGTLNAIVTGAGGDPIAFLLDAPLNTVMLITVAAWIWTGFCLVILSASIKGVSPELLDAGRVDGASELQVFRRITLPLLRPTIVVLIVTMVIASLKAFDIVYVMTNGNFDTEVIANRMFKELLSFNQPGRASAVATILFALIIPAMVINVRQLRREAAFR
jgi:alpha-glucoside transport system permease protein